MDPARATVWKHRPFLLPPPYWLVRALCLHCSSAPCGSAMPFEQKLLCLTHLTKLEASCTLHLVIAGWKKCFYSINGFGKTFWLDCNLIFWVSQATAAILWTDTNGITTKRDHANTCAHTGTKLPAYQTEPVQQPNHNTLWLSQVRHPTTGTITLLTAFSCMFKSLKCNQWHDCISFVWSSHFRENFLSDSVDCFWEQVGLGSSCRWLADSGYYGCCTVPY